MTEAHKDSGKLRRAIQKLLEFLGGITTNRSKQETDFQRLQSKALEAMSLLASIPAKIEKEDTYLIHSVRTNLLKQIDEGEKELSYILNKKRLFSAAFIQSAKTIHNEIPSIRRHVETFNVTFVERRMKQYDYFFKKAANPLDEDQRRAIITDDKHNMVVAGAGTGKTEVLTTRIAYLVERKPDIIAPDRILVLAFQKKAAAEIEVRLKTRFSIDVKIKTFHALGTEILQEYAKLHEQPKPKLKFGENGKRAYKAFVGELVKTQQEQSDYQNEIIRFMKFYGEPEVFQETDFKTKEEYYESQRQLRYTTLDGTKVKSLAESEIMNFFTSHNLNGKKVNVLYEEPALWMQHSDTGQPPRPDFYLREHEIYIEHWAIGKKGKVPPWFKGKNPTVEYKKNMQKKKEEFKNQTKYVLVETSQADYEDGSLLNKLNDRLVEALKQKQPESDFKFEPISYKELVQRVWEECHKSVDMLAKNISDYIIIAKTYYLKPEQIKVRLSNQKWSQKQIAFAQLALPIYEEYEKALRADNSIDFADMINLAVKYLNEDKDLFKDKYDHILIDEYQDISKQRYLLIKSLMEKNNSGKLFCVGDDWQSIMGFTGSNLNFFVKFEHYFDHPARTDLRMNYRSIKSIVDAGATIIKNNGQAQLEKDTIAHDTTVKKLLVYSLLHEIKYKPMYYEQTVKHCIDTIKEYLKNGYNPNDILILCRIISNKPLINRLVSQAEAENLPISRDSKKEDVIRVMTVHRSKGLEARLVIILNVNKGTYGFPCEVENPDVFETAIEESKKKRKEEERRLFYVAVTRAKEDIIIYTQKCEQSEFINEIADHITINELPY